MKIQYALLCNASLIDRDTNMLGIVGVFEEIHLPQVAPQGAIRISYICTLLKDASESGTTLQAELTLQMKLPSGSVAEIQAMPVPIHGNWMRMRVRGDISVPVPEFGRYVMIFKAKHPGQAHSSVFEYEFDITEAQNPQAFPPPPGRH